MVPISGADRNDARRLARRVGEALVWRAQGGVSDRERSLQALAPSRVAKLQDKS